jgi:hypothetical protein
MHSNSDGALDEEHEALLFNAVTNSLQLSSSSPVVERQQYAQRWYMLAVVALLNLSSGMVRIAFRMYVISQHGWLRNAVLRMTSQVKARTYKFTALWTPTLKRL